MGGGTTRYPPRPRCQAGRAPRRPHAALRVRNHPGNGPDSRQRPPRDGAHGRAAVAPSIITGLAVYQLGWAKTPQEWIYVGISFLAVSGCGLAYRRKRGKGLGDDLMAAAEARARTRAQARAACILQARASAGYVNTAGSTVGSFPRRRLGPGYRAAEVDEFIARIEATLSGNARPGQAITAADVQAVKFNVTRRAGYDERTMDEVLDHYADELDKLTPFPPATPIEPW